MRVDVFGGMMMMVARWWSGAVIECY